MWVISVVKKVLTTESSAGIASSHLHENHLVCRAGAVKNVLGSIPSYEFPGFSQVNRSQRETPKQTKSVSLLVS